MKTIVCALALLLCFTAASFAADPSVIGNYVNKKDNTEVLTLNPNGTFLLKQRKNPPDKNQPFDEIAGEYQVDGDKLGLRLKNGQSSIGTLRGNIFEDSGGEKWEKEPPKPKKP